MRCSTCHSEVPDGGRFCLSCGAPLVGSDVATFPAAPRPPRPPLSAPIDESRFIPGTMLADRYRIVALSGRGGMGEVYRAEDRRPHDL